MNEYERLIAYMKIAYNNLTTLHRNLVRDAGWFGNHEQLAKWYGDMGEQIDDLAETGLLLGYREPSIAEAVLEFGSDVLPAETRELDETLRRAGEIMRSVAGLMGAAEAIVPPDVLNRLQEHEYHWNKEANYKIAHALGEPFRRAPEDDD